uniref:Transposase n=1 Tax=Rhizophora mucronata TaxID=61149 RepID=A0A2P2LVG2_RHIMU
MEAYLSCRKVIEIHNNRVNLATKIVARCTKRNSKLLMMLYGVARSDEMSTTLRNQKKSLTVPQRKPGG